MLRILSALTFGALKIDARRIGTRSNRIEMVSARI
jgi:hypothetical protein